MAYNKESLQRRNEKIWKEYQRLEAMVTPKGRMKHSYEAIYEKVAEKFFLSEHRIQVIIKQVAREK